MVKFASFGSRRNTGLMTCSSGWRRLKPRTWLSSAALIGLFAALPMATPTQAQSITTTDNGGGIYVQNNNSVPGVSIGTSTQSSPWVFDLENSGPNPTLVIGRDINAGSPDTLAISSGAVVQSTDPGSNIFIGNLAGSNGLVTIDGTGPGGASTLSLRNTFIIGSSGTGGLQVTNGGLMNSFGNNSIGDNAGSKGKVTIDGAGSTWNTNNRDILVGNFGNGTLNITDGGQAINVSSVSIGQGAGSTGAMTVDGTGSTLTSTGGVFNVGTSGTGTVDIKGGGRVSSTAGVIIGGPGGNGTVTVDGADGNGNASTWTSTGTITVGRSDSFNPATSTGALNITNGGQVFSADLSAVGMFSQATGTVTVDGPGSTWTITGFGRLRVGYASTGTIEITNGGKVVGGGAFLGETAGGNGTVKVDGPGSAWTNTGLIRIGLVSTAAGTIEITNGGEVTSTGGFIGEGAGSTGTVTVNGTGSNWTSSGSLVFGSSGAGTLTLSNDGLVSAPAVFVANQAGSTGTINIGAAAGDPAVAPGTLASPTVALGAAGSLVFNHTSGSYTFLPTISGTGTVQAVAGYTVLTANNTYSGLTRIDAGASLQVGNGGTTGSLGAGAVTDNGALNFDRSDAFTVANVISGSGAIGQIGAGTTILTGNSGAFSGAAHITDGVLRINGTLGNALSTLDAASGGTLGGSGTVGGSVTIANGGILAPNAGGSGSASTLTINGNLGFNGGSILDYNFGAHDVVNGPLNDLTVVHGNLTLDGTINVALTPGGSFDPGVYRVISYDGSLTDNGLVIGTIPAAGFSVQTSVAGEVNLVTSIAPNTYTFWNGADAALHGNNTVNGGDGVWQPSSGNTNWTDQTGTPIGAWDDGSFAIFMSKAGTVTVDNSLGQVTATGMQFDANGYIVQGGDILLIPDGNGQSIIRVGDGASDGANDVATIAARLTGNTRLAKHDLGTLILSGNNTYTGGTVVEGGTLRVSSDENLGDPSGGITLDGGRLNTTASFTTARTLTLTGLGGIVEIDAGTTLNLTGEISGPGSFNKTGAGTLLMTGPTGNWNGLGIVSAGTVRAGAANSFAPQTSVLVMPGAMLDANGFDQTLVSLTNAGMVNIASADRAAMPGVRLTLTGDYVGEGGTVTLGTQWDGDSAAHDQLVVAGNASGATALKVLHRGGGAGALTGVGIDLVKVGGVSTATAFSLSPDSDGYRASSGGVIAMGPFDYTLERGGNGGNANDWYLVSRGYRPEVGSYLDNRYVAMQSQWHTLHDRQSQAPGLLDDDSGNPDANSWARVQGSFGSRRDTGNFKVDDDSYLLHLGSDAVRFKVGEGSIRLGAMGMVAHSSGRTLSPGKGSRASQSVEGASAGAYATWYGRRDTLAGPYVDAWMLGGAFDNKVQGDGLAKEKYHSNVYSASLEAGYGFEVHESRQGARSTRVFVQPQAQVIGSKYRSGDHTEGSGTVVSGLNDSGVATRLGVRVFAEIREGEGKISSSIRPFAEANWLHGANSQAASFDGIRVKDKLPADRAEFKLGVETNVKRNLALWGWAGAQAGSGYSSVSLNAGLRYAW